MLDWKESGRPNNVRSLALTAGLLVGHCKPMFDTLTIAFTVSLDERQAAFETFRASGVELQESSLDGQDFLVAIFPHSGVRPESGDWDPPRLKVSQILHEKGIKFEVLGEGIGSRAE